MNNNLIILLVITIIKVKGKNVIPVTGLEGL
jgi:hypothetical protein